uniref:Putative heme-binding protein 2-like n=1 Tax=Davidia involucrata TaxID=16924 RepID=A0A5B7CCI3_DAVIN
MAAFKLSLVLMSLLSDSKWGLWSSSETSKNENGVGIYPPSCSRIECPSYDLIHVGNGYEIRRYNSTVWMSTSPIQDISLVEATRTGFLQLFDYIQGKNSYEEQIEMTAPVITQVSPSDGPFCASSFVVSFYVPKVNQANPPPAKGLHAQKWGPIYVAVRQFSGFVSDSDVGEEAAALNASLEGSVWAAAIDKSHAADPTTVYTVAQYNSPFEFDSRVNEIWLMFDMEDDLAI